MRAFLLLIFLPLAAMAGTNDGTILLYNDSIYILTATILASDGSYLGQYTIQPGQQSHPTQSLNPTGYKRPGAPDISLTPYTVVWQCPSDEIYSQNNVVGPGSMAQATLGNGPRMCKAKQKQEKETPASTLQKTK